MFRRAETVRQDEHGGNHVKTRSACFVALFAVLSIAGPGGVSHAGAICDPSDAAAVALKENGVGRYTEEPGAGRWKTWQTGPADVTVTAPPHIGSPQGLAELALVKTTTAMRTAATVQTIHRWGSGAATAPWTDVFLEMTRRYSAKPDRDPPRISRQIALFETAMLDALVITWNAKYCYLRPAPSTLDPTIKVEGPTADAPSYPSEHAAAAGVAAVMLATFFPEEPTGAFEALSWEAGNSRIAAGANYQTDISAGIVLGRAVAKRALDARSTDGWDAVWDGSSGRVMGTCNWGPTPPAFTFPPAEPMWGRVRPWLMSSGSQLRPDAPPACDSAGYIAAARDVYETSLTLSDRQKQIASYWAGGGGTETPPGMGLRLAMETANAHGENTMRHARVLAYVGAALADAAISAWDTKFTYWSDRPVTTIRRLWDPSWSPFIGTPPFPGYISGHATFSSASATVLSHFFPDGAVTFRALATEAAMSRFYGGIHVRYDNEVGLTVGGRIGDLAIARASADRA